VKTGLEVHAMSAALRHTLAVALAAALALPARADDDRARARRLTWEGAALYGLATLQQREDRLVSACRTLEDAVRLDPEAIAPRAALIPLYAALGRPDDAAKTAAAVVAMDPAQGPTWLALARLQHDLGRTDEAVATLQKCVAHAALANQPGARAAAAREMGRLLGPAHAAAAAAAYRLALSLYGTLPPGAAPPADVAEAAEGLGRAAARAGQAAEALKAYDQASAAYDQAGDRARSARINLFRAELAAARNDWAAARGLLAPYVAGRPRDLKAYELLARAYREGGNAAGAAAELEAAARDLPDFLPLRVLLGDEYRLAHRYDLAERAYREVIRRAPDVGAYRGLVTVLTQTRGVDAVRNLLEEAYQSAIPDGRAVTDPQAADRARTLAAALRQEPEVVRELLREVVNDRGGFGGGRGRGWFRGQQPPPRAFEAVRVLAELAEATGQLEEAEQILKAAVGDFGFNRGFRGGRMGQVSPGTVDAYLALFRVLRAGHKHREVVALCQEGLERGDAMSSYFHFFAAYSLMRLGRGTEALAEAEEAIKTLNDDSLRLHTRLRRLEVLAFLGRYDQAVADGRKLLDAEEFSAPDEGRWIRLTLSHVYGEARQFDRAEELLRAALDEAPDDATLHNDLGYLLADRGRRLDEAERLIRRAVELDRVDRRRKKELLAEPEENAAYLDSLGWVLFRKGRLAEARDWLKKAAALPEGKGDPVVWDHLGDVSARLGETAAATAAWTEAGRLYELERRSQADARGAEVRRKLERLKSNNK
jgi:tetratricopeptide (TPR) repeat protein